MLHQGSSEVYRKITAIKDVSIINIQKRNPWFGKRIEGFLLINDTLIHIQCDNVSYVFQYFPQE